MGAVFVDNTDLYTGGDNSVKPTELWRQTQTNVDQYYMQQTVHSNQKNILLVLAGLLL